MSSSFVRYVLSVLACIRTESDPSLVLSILALGLDALCSHGFDPKERSTLSEYIPCILLARSYFSSFVFVSFIKSIIAQTSPRDKVSTNFLLLSS